MVRIRTSMLVRRLVRGVRSSCPASETSCVCWRLDNARAASMALKLRASLASSSLPSSSIVAERS